MNDKDYTSHSARAELRRLYGEATPGWWAADNDLLEIGARVNGRAVEVLVANMPRPMDAADVAVTVAMHDALPRLLGLIDAREALLRRCAVALGNSETQAQLVADLRAAGFTTEDK